MARAHTYLHLAHLPSQFRDKEKRIVKIKEGERNDLRRCHVVIVDDLVQSGSTLLSCARVMKDHGMGVGTGPARSAARVLFAFSFPPNTKNILHLMPGAEYVSAFVTHAVFPKQSWKKCQAAGVFHKFWYTDSCPTTAAELKDQAPFELISLAPHIAETLLREDFRQ